MKGLLGQSRVTQVACLLGLLTACSAGGQTGTPAATTAATAVSHNSSYIEPNGTAHVGRIVPVPPSLSPQAQATLRHANVPMPLEKRRAMMDASTARAEKQWRKICPVTVASDTIAGVPVRRITPLHVPAAHADKVLLDLHGGGFDSDSGSYTETIPIAY